MEHSIVLFDGICNFCSSSVQFIIRRDRKGRFRFASLQSKIADQLLAGHDRSGKMDSIVLIDHGKCYTESTAVLLIASRLDGLWKAAAIFLLLPKGIRDPLYRWFARNRYRWFGKMDSCMIPSPEIRERFLE